MFDSFHKYLVHILLLIPLCCFAENDSTEFQRRTAELGIEMSALKDYSAESKIKIATPQCAYINITGISQMPKTKTDNLHAMMEFYDCQGGYFCKKVILNAQGNSSLNFAKKNFAVDFCEDDWIGDKTTDITIGDWVKQDAFHFKAYYNDTFRGIAVVGYKVFSDMLKGESTYQDRAGLTDYDKKAKCFPDGFPCIVYFNGDFYGIYSWQLKKHRKNMSMDKSVETNIHLDGAMNYSTLWTDSVQWSNFEVRNPNNLYSATPFEYITYYYSELSDSSEVDSTCVIAEGNPMEFLSDTITLESPLFYKNTTENGNAVFYKLTERLCYRAKEYDGLYPDELMDEESEYYDANNKNHVLSAKVKANILSFSKYMKEIHELANNGASVELIKATIEERFDVPGLIDYIVFSLVTSNYDGFKKNWQWFTYDARKWFVTPYDLDCILGYNDTAFRLSPAEWSEMWSSHNMRSYINNGPTEFIQTYYMPEIKERYAELRDKQILTPERFLDYLHQWSDAIGEENYELEWKRWDKCRSHSEIITNENWEMLEGYEDWFTLKDFSADSTYNAGDRCIYKNAIWRATNTVSGIEPAIQMGYTDTFERVADWLTKRIALEDEYLEYDSNTLSVEQIDSPSENCGHPIAYYSITGIRMKQAFLGISIVKMNDGSAQKVIK